MKALKEAIASVTLGEAPDAAQSLDTWLDHVGIKAGSKKLNFILQSLLGLDAQDVLARAKKHYAMHGENKAPAAVV